MVVGRALLPVATALTGKSARPTYSTIIHWLVLSRPQKTTNPDYWHAVCFQSIDDLCTGRVVTPPKNPGGSISSRQDWNKEEALVCYWGREKVEAFDNLDVVRRGFPPMTWWLPP